MALKAHFCLWAFLAVFLFSHSPWWHGQLFSSTCSLPWCLVLSQAQKEEAKWQCTETSEMWVTIKFFSFKILYLGILVTLTESWDTHMQRTYHLTTATIVIIKSHKEMWEIRETLYTTGRYVNGYSCHYRTHCGGLSIKKIGLDWPTGRKLQVDKRNLLHSGMTMINNIVLNISRSRI